MTKKRKRVAESAAVWSVAAAKARLSEMLDRAASDGPQTVTRHGKVVAVVVSPHEWERKRRRVGNLAEFFASSPLAGSRLDTRRAAGRLRRTTI